MNFLFAFLTALVISMAIIPLMIRLAPKLGMIDLPDPRKVHAKPIARVGGIGIGFGALCAILIWVPVYQGIAAYLAGSLVLLLFGALDDSYELGHYVKFIGQFIAAIALVYWGDVYVSYVPFLAQPLAEYIGKPFTIIAIVGVINAINHSDGLDGLAGGESLLSLGCIGYLAYQVNDVALLTLTLSVVGGVFGFLRFNTHPAIIFMGDSGSQFLGFSLAAFVILLTQNSNPYLSMAVPLLILGLPVIDILSVFYQRVYQKMNWFQATKNHIHHRLLERGYDHYQSVVIIYSIHILFVISAVLFQYQSDILIVSLYLGVTVIIFATLIYLERKGWVTNQDQSESAFSGVVSRLKTSGWVNNLPVGILVLGLPLYLLLGSIFVSQIPADIATASLVILCVILLAIIMPGVSIAVHLMRATVYGAAACMAYLVEMNIEDSHSVIWGVELAYFVVTALAVAMAVRWGKGVIFQTTPTDYLMVFLVVALGIFAKDYLLEYNLTLLIAKVLVLFYGCEVLLSHQKKVAENVLKYSAAMSLAILGIRGLFIG